MFHDPDAPTPQVVAVDLFCGIGGLTHGLVEEGIEVVAGYDLDPTCRYAYEKNNRGAVFYDQDVVQLQAEALRSHYPEGAVRVLVGCAPCQPFSAVAAKNLKDKEVAEREPEWEPLRAFGRLIAELRPDVVSMENVTRLANREKFPVYGEFLDGLRAAGYEVTEYRPFGPKYGIPQTRRRLVVFASRFGKVKLAPPTHSKEEYVGVGKVLAELPKLEHGQTDPTDRIHMVSKLSDINYRRAKESRPGGTWRDWPEDLWLECHKRPSGHSFPTVYGRMELNKPSPTLTTQFYKIGTGRFVHPTQHRGLSLREGAILQTFPPGYDFVDPKKPVSFSELGRHIGNAVPPRLGQVIAQSISSHLRQAGIIW
ncbi:DNA cytosine methyltransferase [Deinococcus aluminii]|uniref:DNA cytosine methyltransferase n=1 Tax=Deinococcus aluminii TaxID=1656885 RepID=UPI0031EBCDDF